MVVEWLSNNALNPVRTPALRRLLKKRKRLAAGRARVSAHVRPTRPMQFLPLAVVILAAPLVILSALSFDAMVLIEVDRYRETWVADGMPLPLYREHERFSWSFRSWLATNRCLLVWLFAPPDWMREDADASRYLRRFRICNAAFALVAMPLFALSGIVAAVWG